MREQCPALGSSTGENSFPSDSSLLMWVPDLFWHCVFLFGCGFGSLLVFLLQQQKVSSPHGYWEAVLEDELGEKLRDPALGLNYFTFPTVA